MKVIFITREGYNLAGARVRSFNFAKELAKYGVETEVLSYAENLGAKDGINESSMSFSEKIGHNITAYKKLSKEKNAVFIIQRFNYHSFAPLFSRIIGKNRIVLDLDDWEIRENPAYILGFYPTSKAEYLTRKTASLSGFCIAASSYLKNYLASFNDKVYYIPSCVDTDLFSPGESSGGNGHVKFAWTGTLHRKHDAENVKFIIDCFAALKNGIKPVSLDIAGDGIYSGEVVSYISKNRLGDSVNFTGWIHPDKVASYLDRIDVGLFPLIQNTKFNMSKSPVKLFEYMAMEKPVISSFMGEAGNIIEHGKDGFLAKDKEDFISHMKFLFNNSGLRENAGKNARKKIIADYSLNTAGKRLFNALMDMD
jgi:glycosyltransferase involved in cell wall biosynthesis